MSIEKSLLKKRKIFGIDPSEFSSSEEFYKVINPIICDIYNKKIKNINRHLAQSEKRYKQILLRLDKYFYSIDEDFEHSEKIKAYFYKYRNLSEIVKKYEEYKNDETYCQLVEEYLEYLLTRDLEPKKGIISIINWVRQEIMPLEDLSYDESGCYQSRATNTLYTEIAAALFKSSEISHLFQKCIMQQRERIGGLINPSPGKILGYVYSREFKEGIDLLIYINELRKQLENYQSIIAKPSNAIHEYIKTNNSWNAIMQNPYWIRLGRDTYRSCYHPTINLFMIKPGTKTFDKDSIKYFVRRKDKKFESKYKIKCDMMIITIPDSLEEDSLIEIIDFVHENGINLKFICESSEAAHKVKYILIQRELSSRMESGQLLSQTANSNQKYYINGNCWLTIDSDYYNSFLVNTPNNKNLWNQYGCEHSYSDEKNIDIKTLINICIKDYFKEIIPSNSTLENAFKNCCDYDFNYNDSSIDDAIDKEKQQSQSVFTLIKKFTIPTSNN